MCRHATSTGSRATTLTDLGRRVESLATNAFLVVIIIVIVIIIVKVNINVNVVSYKKCLLSTPAVRRCEPPDCRGADDRVTCPGGERDGLTDAHPCLMLPVRLEK